MIQVLKSNKNFQPKHHISCTSVLLELTRASVTTIFLYMCTTPFKRNAADWLGVAFPVHLLWMELRPRPRFSQNVDGPRPSLHYSCLRLHFFKGPFWLGFWFSPPAAWHHLRIVPWAGLFHPDLSFSGAGVSPMPLTELSWLALVSSTSHWHWFQWYFAIQSYFCVCMPETPILLRSWCMHGNWQACQQNWVSGGQSDY